MNSLLVFIFSFSINIFFCRINNFSNFSNFFLSSFFNFLFNNNSFKLAIYFFDNSIEVFSGLNFGKKVFSLSFLCSSFFCSSFFCSSFFSFSFFSFSFFSSSFSFSSFTLSFSPTFSSFSFFISFFLSSLFVFDLYF